MMDYLKNFVKKYFQHFSYFYTHLRYRLFITLFLSLVVAVLDGFGLAMFLPLLQVADGVGQVNPDSLGGLSFLVVLLNKAGIVLTLTSVLVVIVIFFLLKGIAKFFEANYKVEVRQHFIKKLRFDNVQRLTNYEYKAFVLADSGRIQNTLSGEVSRVSLAYQNYMATMQAVVMVLVYVILAVVSNPEFALLVAAGGFLSNIVYRQIYSKTKRASRKITKDAHIYQGLLMQKVAYFKYLKATGLITKYSKKLKEVIAHIEESNRKMGFYGAVLTSSREPLVVLVVAVVIMVQVRYFSQDIGLILLSLMFFYRSLSFLMNLQTHWNGFLNASGALENMTDFLRDLTLHQERTGNIKVSALQSSLTMKNVNFSYEGKTVLTNINLSVKKNQTVAFVGESGSGKTTLVNLLAGLMPVTAGEMMIDGVNLRDVQLASWRQRIGYITQEPVIFSDTIFNNVTFWAEPTDENRKRFWNALEKAAIAEFVRTLPLKEESQLGTNGILVSGGQKQRLSIARELYKDIDVLIMDEATSALDSETEHVIQNNIDALKGYFTILIIAHRLATIKNADRIILLKEGVIENEGSFQHLIQNSELFNKMVTLQEL